jgi:hypothetical protein
VVHHSFEIGVHDELKLFFVDGLGGINKTFIYNLIFIDIQSKGEIALMMTSLRTTTLLLQRNRTTHS